MTTLAGVDMLGYTYDVLGKYADASYIQHLVVPGIQDAEETKTFLYDNLEDAAYEYPATCSVQSSTPSTSSLQSEGSTYEEFSRQTEAKLGVEGSYGGFTGSIDASYSENVKASSSYYYSSIFEAATGYTLRIQDQYLKLTDAVQSDLDDPGLAPTNLFARWGTHVVAGVVVGGQYRYWAYGSQSAFESLDEFTVNVEGSYALASGSGKYSSSQATKTESVESTTGIEVLGGTTEGRSSYETWVATIPKQPAVIAFAPGLLVPLWDFCSDAARGEELAAAFDELYVPRRGPARWVYIEGSASDDAIEVKTDDPDEVVVGFGGNVNTNNNLNRIGICIEKLGSGERYWKQNEAGNFEKSGEVPEGCALTGIALHVTDDKLQHLKLYYQRINRGHSTSTSGSALDPELFTMYVGGEHSGWDLDSETRAGNAEALGGFGIRVKDGKGKTLAQYESDFKIEGDQN